MGGQRHAPVALPSGKNRYPLHRRIGGLQGRPGGVRKISPLPGFDPRAVQPVAIRYTDCAIPAYSWNLKNMKSVWGKLCLYLQGIHQCTRRRIPEDININIKFYYSIDVSNFMVRNSWRYASTLWYSFMAGPAIKWLLAFTAAIGSKRF